MWRSKSHRQISNRIQSVRNQALAWMRAQPHMSGFDDIADDRLDLNDESPYGVAKHFYRLFETHFHKNQNALLRLIDIQLERREMAWLDEPKLCLLDIGAGSGTATLALLDLLCEYREYRWNSKKSVWDCQVAIAAIEPNKHATTNYKQILSFFQPELAFDGITVSVTHISESFPGPDCVISICSDWLDADGHLLLSISSNVIRPIQNFFESAKRWFQTGGMSQEIHLGDIVKKAYDDVIAHFQFEHVAFIDIAAERAISMNTRFVVGVRKIWERIMGAPSEIGSLDWWAPIQEFPQLIFVNDPDSFHGRKSSIPQNATTRYYQEIHVGRNRSTRSDAPWEATLNEKNLELAWARSRAFMLGDHWTDEIEVRLGDFLGSSLIHRLKGQLQRKTVDTIDSKYKLPFFYPKKASEDRPRYFTRLPEQIVFAAAAQAYAEAFEPFDKEYILGNRLNKQRNEFFYEPWFEHFRNYSRAITRAAFESKFICKFDIKSYYASIPQDRFVKHLQHSMNSMNSSALTRCLKACFECDLLPPHRPATGLPQTAIFAGLWTSHYLSPLDREMLITRGLRGIFYRYADDMALIIDQPSDIDEHVKQIQSTLDRLGLTLNDDKHRVYAAKDYAARFTSDDQCNSLSQSIFRLLNGLYIIPRSYRSVYRADSHIFAHIYHLLLRRVGIYLTDHWLKRKLYQKISLPDIVNHWRYGLRVNFPIFPTEGDVALDLWAEEFMLKNLPWANFRKGLVDDLVTLFNENLSVLDSSSSDELSRTAATRAIRFATNRLSVLGLDPIVDSITDILCTRPWLISNHTMLKALVLAGYSDRVIEMANTWHQRGFQGTSLSNLPSGQLLLASRFYLCAVACKALGFGKADDMTISFLWAVLSNKESTEIERISASEGLLRLGAWNIDWRETIKEVLEDAIDQPYLQKNLILMLASSRDLDSISTIREISLKSHNFVVRDAAQFVLTQTDSIFSQQEPDVLRNYYARKYPLLPVELSDIYSAMAL